MHVEPATAAAASCRLPPASRRTLLNPLLSDLRRLRKHNMRLLLTALLLAVASAASLAAGSPAEGAGAATAAATAAAAAGPAPLRLWIDEFFFAEGETALLREAVEASGGAAVLAGTTRNRVLQLKSYQQAARADVLWTGLAVRAGCGQAKLEQGVDKGSSVHACMQVAGGACRCKRHARSSNPQLLRIPPSRRRPHPRQGCYEAFRRSLNASHAVSCVPGSQALSGKAALAATLEAAYGPAAWGLLPLSFHLPRQFPALAAHLRQVACGGPGPRWRRLHGGGDEASAEPVRSTRAQPALRSLTTPPPPATPCCAAAQEQAAGGSSLWVLKEDVHRGRGVAVADPARTLLRALERTPRAQGGGQRHVLAQAFLGQQLLVGARPFYIR